MTLRNNGFIILQDSSLLQIVKHRLANLYIAEIEGSHNTFRENGSCFYHETQTQPVIKQFIPVNYYI